MLYAYGQPCHTVIEEMYQVKGRPRAIKTEQ